MNIINDKIKRFFKSDAQLDKSAENERKGVWEKVQAISVNTFKFSLTCLFVILIGYTIYELFRYDLVIKPFEMPFQLGRQGYTGTVVAYRLQHYMEEKRNELKTNAMRSDKSMAAIQFSELERRPEIDVPALGLSLNMVIAQLRRMLGIKQRRVGGNVVVREGKLYLTLRITGQPDLKFSGENDYDPESVIKKAAKQVLETFEPLSVGLSYCLNHDDKALKNLIKDRQKTRFNDKSKEVVTLTLEACLLKNQQAFIKALDKLTQAEKYDRKNSIIFYVKGNTLQSYGDYNENNRLTFAGTLKSLMLTIINSSYDEAILAYQTAIIYEPKNGGIYAQWARTLIKKANQQEDNTLKQTLLEKAFAKYQIASKKDPKNPWVYTDWGYQLAEVYHQSERTQKEKMFEIAVEKFIKAIDVDPYYALAYATWGDVLLKFQKSYQEAAQKYEKAVELHFKAAWVYGNWGVALLKQKKYQAAIVKFEMATTLKSEAWFYKEWGNILFLMNKYQQAIVQFKKAVELAPNDWYSYYVLGKTLNRLERYQEAITQYQKSLKINSTFVWSYNRWGYALLQLNKPKEALEQCQAALKSEALRANPSNKAKAGAYALRGLALTALNQPQKAIEACKTALKLNKTGEWIPQCLEKALAKINKPEVFARYEFVIKSLNKREKRHYYYAWGEALSQLGQYEQAIIRYQKALAIEPEHIWSHVFMGYAYVKVQKPDDAFTECDTVLKSPNAKKDQKAAAHALCGLAEIGLKRPEPAIKQCKTALTIRKKEDWAYWCLGDALVLLNKLEEAVIQYEKAVNLKPDSTFYYYKWEQALTKSEQAAIMQDEKAK
jgi:tetratricopeptide (TPR) repeat protein